MTKLLAKGFWYNLANVPHSYPSPHKFNFEKINDCIPIHHGDNVSSENDQIRLNRIWIKCI